MCKVSVIVPVYKVEKCLDRCIDSITNQTLKDIEIILVDDGSPDSSGEICDRHALEDKRIMVIHKKNGGVSAARNDGLAKASGEFVIFVDSDDWMEADACELLYDAAQKNNSDIVIADVNRITANSSFCMTLFNTEFTYTLKPDVEQLIISTLYPPCCKIAKNKKTGYGGPWNKLISMNLIKKLGLYFNPNVGGICDDRLFIAEAYANAKRISYVQKPVYNYVEVQNSITKSFKANILKMNETMFSSFVKVIDSFCNISDDSARDVRGRQEWGDALFKAYDAFVIWRLENALQLYFFSEKNTNKHSDVMAELRKVIKSEPYYSAPNCVDNGKLRLLTRLISCSIKIGSANLARTSFRLYKFMKKLI